MNILPHITMHALRDHLANTLRTLGTQAGLRFDWIAAEMWQTALLDGVIDTVTGKSIGQWFQTGADALADYIGAQTKKGKDVGEWADEIFKPWMRALIAQHAPAIKEALSSTPWPELFEEAPQGAQEYAAWAVKCARRLGVELTDFLAARANLSPTGGDNW